MSGIMQVCPRCQCSNVRLLTKGNQTVCTVCMDLADSDLRRPSSATPDREEFEKLLATLTTAAEKWAACRASGLRVDFVRDTSNQLARLYDEASRLSVSPPKFTQEDVIQVRGAARHAFVTGSESYVDTIAVADKISSTLSPAPPHTCAEFPDDSCKGCIDDYGRPVRELRCQKCGRDYPVWTADNGLWNRVAEGKYHFLCLDCFALLAEAGGVTHVWHLGPASPAPTAEPPKWNPSEAELAELQRRSAEAKAHPETLVSHEEMMRRLSNAAPSTGTTTGVTDEDLMRALEVWDSQRTKNGTKLTATPARLRRVLEDYASRRAPSTPEPSGEEKRNCAACGGENVRIVTGKVEAKWGRRLEVPKVEITDTRWRCRVCREEWYTKEQSERHFTALFKATIEAMADHIAELQTRPVAEPSGYTRADLEAVAREGMKRTAGLCEVECNGCDEEVANLVTRYLSGRPATPTTDTEKKDG